MKFVGTIFYFHKVGEQEKINFKKKSLNLASACFMITKSLIIQFHNQSLVAKSHDHWLINKKYILVSFYIWVRSRRCGCLVTGLHLHDLTHIYITYYIHWQVHESIACYHYNTPICQHCGHGRWDLNPQHNRLIWLTSGCWRKIN